MSFLSKAQCDTTEAARNVDTLIFYRDTIDIKNKMPGNMIPHLVLYNLTNINVPIELSADGQTWSDFKLDPHSKRLFRCDGISKMLINVFLNKSDTIKAKIYVHKTYKIFYYEGVKVDLIEMP